MHGSRGDDPPPYIDPVAWQRAGASAWWHLWCHGLLGVTSAQVLGLEQPPKPGRDVVSLARWRARRRAAAAL